MKMPFNNLECVKWNAFEHLSLFQKWKNKKFATVGVNILGMKVGRMRPCMATVVLCRVRNPASTARVRPRVWRYINGRSIKKKSAFTFCLET